MEVNNSSKLREKVANYINKDARRKNVEAGLDLMKETGYKPNVYNLFFENKFRRDIPQKLDRELRNYMRYAIAPDDTDHQDIETEVPNAENVIIENVEVEIKSIDGKEYPDAVKKVLTAYSDLYKQRSILHKKLKQIGESNSDEDVLTRKNIASAIQGISHHMDILWEKFKIYKETGQIPSEEILKEPFDPDKKSESDEKPSLALVGDLEGLKKQKENWRIKLMKAENRLLYQSEKKQPKENPMPKGPKRITLEKRIARLKAEKEQIEYAIAEKS